MSINYKNASVILANTNMTTVLTIPVTAVAIVKSVYISNNSTGAVTVNCDFRDSSATSDVEPLVIFLILVKVLTLSPGFTRSGL